MGVFIASRNIVLAEFHLLIIFAKPLSRPTSSYESSRPVVPSKRSCFGSQSVKWALDGTRRIIDHTGKKAFPTEKRKKRRKNACRRCR